MSEINTWNYSLRDLGGAGASILKFIFSDGLWQSVVFLGPCLCAGIYFIGANNVYQKKEDNFYNQRIRLRTNAALEVPYLGLN